jgi:hypothetical protein
MTNKFILPIILGLVICLAWIVAAKIFKLDAVDTVLILLIIIAAEVYAIASKLVHSEKKFAGYVCEQCGAEYNHCNHKHLEDYTLVKKA